MFEMRGMELPQCKIDNLSRKTKIELMRIYRKPEFDHMRKFFFEDKSIDFHTKNPRRIALKQSKYLVKMFEGKGLHEDLYKFPIKKDVVTAFVARIMNASATIDNQSKRFELDYLLVQKNYEKFEEELLKDHSFLNDLELKKVKAQMRDITYLVLKTTSHIPDLSKEDFSNFEKVKSIVDLTLGSYLNVMKEDYQRSCYKIDRKLSIFNKDYKDLQYFSNPIPFDTLLSSLESAQGGLLGVYLTCSAMNKEIPSRFKSYEEAQSYLRKNKVSIVAEKSNDDFELKITLRRNRMAPHTKSHGIFSTHGFKIKGINKSRAKKAASAARAAREARAAQKTSLRNRLSPSERAIGRIPIKIPWDYLDDKAFDNPYLFGIEEELEYSPNSVLAKTSMTVESKISPLEDMILKKVQVIVQGRNLINSNENDPEETNSNFAFNSNVSNGNSRGSFFSGSHPAIGKDLSESSDLFNSDESSISNSANNSETRPPSRTNESNSSELNDSESSNSVTVAASNDDREALSESKEDIDDTKENQVKERTKKSFFSYFSSPISYVGQSGAVSFPSFGEEFKKKDVIAYKQASVSKRMQKRKRKVSKVISPKVRKYHNRVKEDLAKSAIKELSYDEFKKKRQLFAINKPSVQIQKIKIANEDLTKLNVTGKKEGFVTSNSLNVNVANIKKKDESKKQVKAARGLNSNMNSASTTEVPKNAVKSSVPSSVNESLEPKPIRLKRPKKFILEKDFVVMSKDDILNYADSTHMVYVIVKKEIQHIKVDFLETYEYRVVGGEVFKKLISSESIFRVRPSGKKLEVMNEFFSLKRQGVLQ